MVLTGSNCKHVSFRDPRLSIQSLAECTHLQPEEAKHTHQVPVVNGEPIILTKARSGDTCPNCNDSKIRLQQAVEIGHTFHLRKRYSIPLEASVLDAHNQQVPVEMGCHGIGVSRLIGAVASLLADKKGLNWPLAISPFTVLIVPTSGVESSELEAVFDRLAGNQGEQDGMDVAIDDRERAVGWKLKDADLVGYPFIVVMGSAWRERKAVELQCRRLGLNTEVSVENLWTNIRGYSEQL